MVSMKAVAAKCNVSIATVSKALSNGTHKDISDETRERIRLVANELGYYPNQAARTLKTNRSNNLGVLFTDAAYSGLTHDFFAPILDSFKNEAESRGYDITFLSRNQNLGSSSYVERCRQRSIDGVIIACIDFNQKAVIELLNSDIPVVTIDYVTNNCSSIVSDNQKGLTDLCEYVISKGHKKIAYIYGDEDSAVTKIRLASFFRTLEKHGISIPEEYVRSGRYLGLKEASEQTNILLDLHEPPTCILYPDDTALFGGINTITERGLKIGEDISIAGFDGLKMASVVTPKLTTVYQNTTEIGKKAADKLIDQIENPKTTVIEHLVVETELVSGESVCDI
ncbi:MAG: LacI family transcriptional regulator [Lachnospiraceae bacterium]|nr:LacI family transcriptional regulator [Lachnospiraceae bacterium]